MSSVTKSLPLTIVASNVTASAHPTYNPATTYAVGAKVKAVSALDGLTYEYESLADDNEGNPLSDTTWWLNLGPSNRDAMFDSRTSTTTTRTGDIVVTLSTAGQNFDSIAVLNIGGATSVSIEVKQGATTLYSDTQSLIEDVTSWYDFFFAPLDNVKTKYIWNPYIFPSDAQVTLTIAGTTPSIGLVTLGRRRDMALTEYGATVGIEDYSTKETDQWGRTYLLERAFAETAEVKMVLPTGQVDALKATLADLRATPALYDLNNDGNDFDSLIIFGKYDSFSIDIAYHSTAYCTLTLTELI